MARRAQPQRKNRPLLLQLPLGLRPQQQPLQSPQSVPAPGGGAGQVLLNTKTNVCRTIAYSWLAYAALFFARKFRLRLRTNASARFSSALKSVCRVAIWMGSPAD